MEISFLQNTFNGLSIYYNSPCYLLGQQICLYPEKKQIKHELNLQSTILNQLLPVWVWQHDDIDGVFPVVFTICFY